jgi:tetratricopeptide (TPR) repeat protein
MTTEEGHVDKLQVASDLFASYRQDQAAGILDMRLRWGEVDDEVLIITAGWAGSAEQEIESPDAASRFGTLGLAWAFFVEAHNTITFHQVLETVVEHRGDLPASDRLQRYALDILRGRVHLVGAIRLVSADHQLQACLPGMYQTFLPGIDPRKYPLLAQTVRLAAAAALPRKELYRLRGVSTGEPSGKHAPMDSRHLDEIRAEYGHVMEEALATEGEADTDRAEELLVHALDLAMESPEPDDDIEVLQRILQLAERFQISKAAVKRCANAVEGLVKNGHRTTAVARCLIALGVVIGQQGLTNELGQAVVSAGSRLIEEELDGETVVALKTAVARAWLGLGRTERARSLLREVDEARLTPLDRLNVAALRADALQIKRRSDRAVELLERALAEAADEEPVARLPALQKLLACWPPSRGADDLVPHVDELLETAKTLKEPRRTLALVGAALRLWPSGQKMHALRAWSSIDEERLRRETPPMMAEKVLGMIEKARQKLDTSQSETVAH